MPTERSRLDTRQLRRAGGRSPRSGLPGHLHEDSNGLSRLISTIHLSRPENYLSIYQSGCNLACRKCHSASFSKVKQGCWYRPQDILRAAKAYERRVTLVEPRERATAWYAQVNRKTVNLFN